MTVLDPEKERTRQAAESRVRQQVAFASGLFQGDVTIRTLLESLAEGVVIIDNAGTILLVNAFAEKMFGYGEKELIGKPHAVLIPERFRKVHEGHQAQFFAEPKIRPMGQLRDLAGLHQDGSEFPIEICLSFIDTINGVLVMAFVSDITVRKQFERHLLESDLRFVAFMRNLPAAAWMKDLEGRYVYANPEAECIFSTPLSTLQGKTDEEIFAPETARQFRENDQQVLAENAPLQIVEVLRQANHIEHYSLVNKFPVASADGELAYIAGVAFDITELMEVEKALRESKEMFSKVFDTAPVGITISSLSDGRFIDINKEGERLSGYGRDEVIGRTAQEFNIWKDPSERARMIEEVQKDGMVRDREMTFSDKNGNILSGLFSAAIIDILGKKHLLSIVSDITARRLAEHTLERAKAALETANRRELEAFNYTVAHDLRQPLNIIGGYAQAIERLWGDLLPEECKDYLHKAYEATLSMNKLIEALLNLSRLEGVELNREEVDLSALAHELVAVLKVLEPERQVAFSIADGMTANADASLLRVVLDNLLGNAWKYSATRDKAVIEVGMTVVGEARTFFVCDNGNGFDMMHAGQLFTAFHRLPGTGNSKGFGIGLATVERIILRHGGRVWAKGEPGKGACFYFTLPGT
jgi:PAS domain S-box-containing protein